MGAVVQHHVAAVKTHVLSETVRCLSCQVLIFVNSVDEGFRVKLFLESFGISAAVLNAELPLNSRSHILQTFNKGLFDYLVATGRLRTVGMHQGSHGGVQSMLAVTRLFPPGSVCWALSQCVLHLYLPMASVLLLHCCCCCICLSAPHGLCLPFTP